MRRRPSLASIAWIAALGLFVGCGDDKPSAPTPPAKQDETKAPVAPPPLPPYETPERVGEVVGHVRIADGAALLATLEPLLPPQLADSITPDAIVRRLSRGASSAASVLLQHMDPGKAAGCVVLDTATRDAPYACVIGYGGGLAQLKADIGREGMVDDGAAGLHLERDGTAWFFDELGEHVVFANEPDAFDGAKAYLEQLTHPGGERAIEVVLYTAHAAEAYRKEMATLLVAAAAAAQSPSGDPELTGLERELFGLSSAVSERALDALDELMGIAAKAERVVVSANLGEQGLALAIEAEPTSGGTLAAWARSSVPLDASLWDWLPNGTWLLWAANDHPAGALRPMWSTLKWTVLGHYLGRFIEQNPADVVTAGNAFAAQRREVYGDWALFAAFNSPATRGGVMLVRPKKAGVDARTRWLDWATALTPKALLGDELGTSLEQMVTWKVVPTAATVEGLTVDEWRLLAAPALLDELDRSLPEGNIGKDIVAVLRKRDAIASLQRFELDDAVVFTFAPGGTNAYASKVIRAKKGEGRLDPVGVLAALADRGKAYELGALSAHDLLVAVREMVPPDLRADLPATVGRDLSDASFTAAVDDDGTVRFDVVVSASLVRLVARGVTR